MDTETVAKWLSFKEQSLAASGRAEGRSGFGETIHNPSLAAGHMGLTPSPSEGDLAPGPVTVCLLRRDSRPATRHLFPASGCRAFPQPQRPWRSGFHGAMLGLCCKPRQDLHQSGYK
ncbi:hypothetical protein AAFF_G00140740 [Aldrovandia affinis]|uniref:Uncharacterized protein n=1 Tax=Aldrovandia affinis TaxID=143900 RepID=A0AAD7X2X9_9TELE|nr:hypothetical protein AAFF_G00140740 [Aldrovandia affinis]